MFATQTVPTVRLGDYARGGAVRARFVETVGDGLRELGFLTVEGHGIAPQLIRTAYGQWQRFFELPLATKRRYALGQGGGRGYTPLGVEHAKGTATPDLKEFWHVGQEPPAGHPFRLEYPGNVWPDELPELRQPTFELYRALERVAAELLRAVAELFDLPRDTFASMIEVGNSILRVIHYPPVPPVPPVTPGSGPAVRAAAHEDINLITLLCEATDSGLELLTRDGRWLPVAALPGQIVVDAGDMLSRVTNEAIPATTHRVVNPREGGNRDRYSMPFFVHPYSACDLTVLDRFVSAENPPRYPPITAGRFLDERLREIGLMK